jgi:hypothetical protein
MAREYRATAAGVDIHHAARRIALADETRAAVAVVVAPIVYVAGHATVRAVVIAAARQGQRACRQR